jgi:hypothetical protein
VWHTKTGFKAIRFFYSVVTFGYLWVSLRKNLGRWDRDRARWKADSIPRLWVFLDRSGGEERVMAWGVWGSGVAPKLRPCAHAPMRPYDPRFRLSLVGAGGELRGGRGV